MKTLNEKYCYECAEVLRRDATICVRCGTTQPILSAATFANANELALYDRDGRRIPGRNRTVAVFFALLLGGFGLHRVYLGRPASGFVYLAFCWTLVPAFIAFVEGIRLLAMSEAKFAAKYPYQVSVASSHQGDLPVVEGALERGKRNQSVRLGGSAKDGSKARQRPSMASTLRSPIEPQLTRNGILRNRVVRQG